MPWRICHATAFEPEAHLVKGFLEHQGIPCLLENRRVPVDPLRSGIGSIRILVPEEWVPVASKLISHRTRRRYRPKGEVIEVDFQRRRRVRREVVSTPSEQGRRSARKRARKGAPEASPKGAPER